MYCPLVRCAALVPRACLAAAPPHPQSPVAMGPRKSSRTQRATAASAVTDEMRALAAAARLAALNKDSGAAADGVRGARASSLVWAETGSGEGAPGGQRSAQGGSVTSLVKEASVHLPPSRPALPTRGNAVACCAPCAPCLHV